MANNTKTVSTSSSDKRVLQALVAYLRRRGYSRADYAGDDRVLQNKTLAQINQAFDIIEKKTTSAIENYYLKLMDGRSEYSTTPGQCVDTIDWTPLSEMRWQPIRCNHVLAGSTMLVFTPVDVFSIMWCKVTLERTERIFYGLQSLLAKEHTKYFLAYTANPSARKPSWRLRSLGGHEIAKGLPIILGTTSSFPAQSRAAFQKLNPLPPLQAIPEEQGALHDFVVQIVTGEESGGRNTGDKSIMYSGRQFGGDPMNAPPVARRDTREGGTRGNSSELLLQATQMAREQAAAVARGVVPACSPIGGVPPIDELRRDERRIPRLTPQQIAATAAAQTAAAENEARMRHNLAAYRTRILAEARDTPETPRQLRDRLANMAGIDPDQVAIPQQSEMLPIVPETIEDL